MWLLHAWQTTSVDDGTGAEPGNSPRYLGVQLPEVSSSDQDALPLHVQSADRKAVLPFISAVCLRAREVAVLRDI